MKRYRKFQKIKKKKPFFKKKIFWVTFLIFLVFFFCFYFFIFSPYFQIQNYQIEGAQKIKKEKILNFIESKISKKFLFFETKSIFLIDLKKLQTIILENFPQISEIKFLRKFPNTLYLLIEERKPVAVFATIEKNFFIDKLGTVFEEVLNEENSEFLILESEISPSEIKLGQRVIPKELMEPIFEIQEKIFKNLEIKIKKIKVISEETLIFQTFENWSIYFKPKDIDWQIIKLKTVLEREISQEKREKLDYIDVRFGNFAPYKLK